MSLKRTMAALLALCLPLLSLAACGTKKVKLYLPLPADCAYAAGEYVQEANTVNVNKVQTNTYGNSPYAAMAVNRRAVQTGAALYTAVNAAQALQKIEADGSVATLYDQNAVGQVSYYAGYVYFSDYVAVTEPMVRGEFYAQRLFRLNVKEGAKEPELLYEARTERECFGSFQLCNGSLYLIGAQVYSTFGVQRLGLDGKTDGKTSPTLLSEKNTTAQQVSGDTLYYLVGGVLYAAALRGVERRALLADTDVRAFCATEEAVYFAREGTPGVFALDRVSGEVTQIRAEGEVEAFFATAGAGAPDCFVIKPEGAAATDTRQLVYQPGDGAEKILAEDVMPLHLSFMQPFCEGGKVYYFSCDTQAVHGYIRAVEPATGTVEECYDWAITKAGVPTF